MTQILPVDSGQVEAVQGKVPVGSNKFGRQEFTAIRHTYQQHTSWCTAFSLPLGWRLIIVSGCRANVATAESCNRKGKRIEFTFSSPEISLNNLSFALLSSLMSSFVKEPLAIWVASTFSASILVMLARIVAAIL